MNELHDLAHLNVWVYNYLLEQGLRHSAFVFRTETQLKDCDISPAPTGFLTNLVEKGLLYTELETEIIQDMCAPLGAVNGETRVVDEEHIQSYIDRRINERLADCALGKDLVLERAESKPVNEMVTRDIYKIFVYDRWVLVWNQSQDKVYLVDIRNGDHSLNKAWTISLGSLMPSFKLSFHQSALFYSESTLMFVDYKNEFKVTNIFSFTQANGATIKTVERTDSYTIVSTSSESDKYLFDAGGNFVTTLEGNAKYIELPDSLIVCSFSSNQIERKGLHADSPSIQYTTIASLTLVDACLNHDKTILAGYFLSKETQKGEIHVWLTHQPEYLYSLETKGVFKELKFNIDNMLTLIGPQVIKILNVAKAEFVFSEQFESIIRGVDCIGDSKLIVELIGNRIKKIDFVLRTCTEIDKSSYGSHMYVCPAVAKVFEFENLESFKFIDL
jgi:hypothetical protein